ncbi:hypothetical protein JCM33374_g5351 [Metschnikowia sp. JCM 33374]|nr:hypothetical protein JCM33374_g5351 [Metschnikowia sp. JCM 33374]
MNRDKKLAEVDEEGFQLVKGKRSRAPKVSHQRPANPRAHVPKTEKTKLKTQQNSGFEDRRKKTTQNPEKTETVSSEVENKTTNTGSIGKDILQDSKRKRNRRRQRKESVTTTEKHQEEKPSSSFPSADSVPITSKVTLGAEDTNSAGDGSKVGFHRRKKNNLNRNDTRDDPKSDAKNPVKGSAEVSTSASTRKPVEIPATDTPQQWKQASAKPKIKPHVVSEVNPSENDWKVQGRRGRPRKAKAVSTSNKAAKISPRTGAKSRSPKTGKAKKDGQELTAVDTISSSK